MVFNKELSVGIAELKIAENPKILTCSALGSCVAIVLYESNLKIGALAHIMLPDSNEIKKSKNSAKFADTAIKSMIRVLTRKGADKKRLMAKIVGGAHMFDNIKNGFMNNIGSRNVTAAKTILMQEGIKVISEDTGGKYGRTVRFYATDGKLIVRSIKGKKEI